ncbi:hypothetical protein VNI00_018899 [Paramarasmius palmivorus]|uniref:Uncharacterized protein n=1 Tax=Paramarasmius palmivorus TaxID=297713 RepID=A0AAW0ATK8_9AGAR
MTTDILGLPEALRNIFSLKTTRSGSTYSPYTLNADVQLDSLIFNAIARDYPDPLGSPLTTPPSSPVPSRSPSPVDHSSTPSLPLLAETLPDNLSGPGPEPYSHSSGTRKRKRRPKSDKKHSHASHAKKRKLKWIGLCSDETTQQEHHLHPRIFEFAAPTTEFDPATLKTASASTGYIGTAAPLPEIRQYCLEDLVNDGEDSFELMTFESGVTRYIPCRDTGKIMALVVPGPHADPTWKATCKEAADLLRELRPKQRKPLVLSDLGIGNRRIMDTIRFHLSFIRIITLAIFLAWAPRLFSYYVQIMALLLGSDDQLFRPFSNSPFAAFTVNFGPKTVCLPHRDSKNLAFRWCGICALGNFDYVKGGHLVLWDMKLVIEFPPGTIIFIPSAICCHFNTAIQEGEERFSFTTYSAGGLFRWVEHGFQLEDAFKKTEEAVKEAKEKNLRWAKGINLFSSIEELLAQSVEHSEM